MQQASAAYNADIKQPCCGDKIEHNLRLENVDMSKVEPSSWLHHNNFNVSKPKDHVETPDLLTHSSFGIAVNGVTIAEGDTVNKQRVTDLALQKADVHLSYDNKVASKKLSAIIRRDARDDIIISPYSNYPLFVHNYEIKIQEKGTGKDLELYSIKPNEMAAVKVHHDYIKDNNLGELVVIVRAYDDNGRFDETKPITIAGQFSNDDIEEGEEKKKHVDTSSGFGENHISIDRLPVHGGTITVNGKQVKENGFVDVFGAKIPADANGNMVAELIVPNGQNNINIAYEDSQGKQREFIRPIDIKENDLFYVALGELTYGQNDFEGPSSIQDANPDEFEKEYLHGRAAFYLKGKVKGEYLITAMADTGEGDVEQIFKNFDEKDTRSLLRRIDADRYYPVYGDDSSIEETAPTQGKMFVKIERDKSYAMWGNYETNIKNDDFTQLNRTLYGAKLHYEDPSITKYGESVATLTGFAADAGTFNTRDEFRGTGGSIYFLNYQDITVGSEKLRIEVRDRHSGIVNYVKELSYGRDYDVDYFQGRIILHEPLMSTASDGDVISSSVSEFGDPVVLVADYETTPVGTTIKDNHIYGGTSQFWLNDSLLVGATAGFENIKNGIDKKVYGANSTLRYSDKTYIKGSVTASEGGSSPIITSIDGGYNNSTNAAVNSDDTVLGYAVEAALDLADISENFAGFVNAYYRNREAGFAGQGYATLNDIKQYGGAIQIGDSQGVSAKVEADVNESGANSKTERYLGELAYKGDNIFGTIGLSHEKDSFGNEMNNVGARVGVTIEDRGDLYIFGQTTFDSKGSGVENDRIGLGANIKVSDKITLGGEVAVNEAKDITARAKIDYAHNEDSNFYLAYDISSDRNNTGSGYEGIIGSGTGNEGAIVVGGKKRFSDSLSIYGEEKYYTGSGSDGLTHTYGVDFTPWNDLTLGGSMEIGTVDNLDRKAYSLNIGYGVQDTHISLAGEYRKEEDTDSNMERDTYAVRANARHEIDDEFTMIARGNASFSDNNQASVEDGEFVEGSLGIAYRPVDNDTLNLLAKYTYLYDLATNPQINSGTALSAKQKVHIASVDGTLQLSDYLAIGLKYGYKKGEVDFGSGWLDTTTHLGVARADFHVVHNWDALIEGRMLYQDESQNLREGALAGIYYHIDNNIKVGGGYSWSDFSDDITNENFNNKGWFVNLVSKF